MAPKRKNNIASSVRKASSSTASPTEGPNTAPKKQGRRAKSPCDHCKHKRFEKIAEQGRLIRELESQLGMKIQQAALLQREIDRLNALLRNLTEPCFAQPSFGETVAVVAAAPSEAEMGMYPEQPAAVVEIGGVDMSSAVISYEHSGHAGQNPVPLPNRKRQNIEEHEERALQEQGLNQKRILLEQNAPWTTYGMGGQLLYSPSLHDTSLVRTSSTSLRMSYMLSSRFTRNYLSRTPTAQLEKPKTETTLENNECTAYYSKLSKTSPVHNTEETQFYTRPVQPSYAHNAAPEVQTGQDVDFWKSIAFSLGVMLYKVLRMMPGIDHVATKCDCDDHFGCQLYSPEFGQMHHFIRELTLIRRFGCGYVSTGLFSVNPAIIVVMKGLLHAAPQHRLPLERFVQLFASTSTYQFDTTVTGAKPLYKRCQ